MSRPADIGPLGEVTCVQGESFVVSGPDGDIQPGGDQGLYVRDTRFLNHLELLIDGERPRTLSGRAVQAATATFYAYAPRDDDRGVDPTLLVTRRRLVDGSLHEEVAFDNRAGVPRNLVVAMRLGADFAYIFDVKHGRTLPAASPQADGGALLFSNDGSAEKVVIRPSPGAQLEGDRLSWKVDLPARSQRRLWIDVATTDVYGTVEPGRRFDEDVQVATAAATDAIQVRCSDDGFARLIERSLQDVASLRLSDPQQPTDRFCAAGSPWYLTLFGRDALWTAWMTLPFDLELAAGTLRTLARRQGTVLDPDTEEAPGKILHEIRRGGLAHRGDLPPNYYGTVDATPLFVILLHEAWSWGLAEPVVRSLLGNLEAALAWMRDHGDPDGDGFLEYAKQGERGLDNQGWKDSFDGVQFADGRIAQAPISLVEVQAYAWDAARRGAELLERFDRPGAEEWRAYADLLEQRFHERFWLEDDAGRYLAIALDADDVPVDAVTSNMGHVLASGMLRGDDARAVTRRLVDPTMDSGWGLRTMATTMVGYNPLSYHGGTVWPHDTAIAVWGCALAGDRDAATSLARGLIQAAPYFRFRLPELFAGFARGDGGFPVPYPAACRPQAWSAAAALLLLRAFIRPQPRIPDGRLTLAPLWPPVYPRLEVRSLPLAGGRLDLVIDAVHGVEHRVCGTDVEIEVLLPDEAPRSDPSGGDPDDEPA